MGSIDGEIPAVWFLISSIGFIILSLIQYKNSGKSFNTIFLSVMAIIFGCDGREDRPFLEQKIEKSLKSD